MRSFFSILICSALMLAFASCNKSTEINDLNNPEIELIYPSDNPSLAPDLPFCIKAVITDDQVLGALRWEIIESSTGIVRMHQDLNSGYQRSVVIDESIRIAEHLKGNYIFRITATDGTGNTSKLTIPFTLHD